MSIYIRKTKKNKKLISQICKILFPSFHYVRLVGKDIKFKRAWYSFLNRKVTVAELVLNEIPKGINNLYKDKGYDELYPNFDDMYDALEYFEYAKDKLLEEFMYRIEEINLYKEISEIYDESPSIMEDIKIDEIEESVNITILFDESVKYYTNKFIDSLEPYLLMSVVHKTSSGCHSPPENQQIRGHPALITMAS